VLEGVTDITESKEHEKAIQKERSFLEKLLETSPVSIAVVNKEGKISQANAMAENTLGLKRSDLYNRAYNDPAWRITDYNGNNFPEEKLPFQIVKKTGSAVFGVEHAIEWPDGKRVLLSINSAPLFDGDGNFDGVVSAIENVTERKEAQERLLKSEAHLEEAQRIAHVGSWNWIAATDAPTWSKELCRILEVDPDRPVPSMAEQDRLYTPDSMVRMRSSAENAMQTGNPYEIELERLRDDGSRRWLLARGERWYDEQGKIIGLRGTALDITERKEAEKALRESEEKYKLLVEKADEAIFVAQDDFIKFPNPKTIEITGYSEEELSTIPFVDLIHPEDKQMVAERYRQRLSGEKPPSDYTVRIINKNGSELWLQINAAPITWEGRPATLNIIRDITEQRQLEEEVRQSRKMESIGTLAGGIAHEFNNMLGIIIGNTELAMDDIPEWNPAADCIQEIRTASLRAKDVVRKLLSVARKTPTSRKPIQISPIIRESLGLLRKTIPATIDIRQNIQCSTEMILGDATELNQVVINLCTNSVHAMSEQTGVLQVDLETIQLDRKSAIRYENLNPGGYAKLTVRDSGFGIKPGLFEQIFDPYFTTKDVDEGLGMGLAVVHGIVKKHDGAINIESEVGKGTTVEVLFPLIEGQEVISIKETETHPTGTERILVIDDESSLVKMVTQILERSGYEVVGKTSSPDALKAFKEDHERFDLVITDVAMPEMSGERVAQEIIQIRPDIPIILCTGHSDRMDENRAMALGIKSFVMKPLERTDLTKTVRKVLDEAKSKGCDELSNG
jgi:PAS domain S-box-containing protein